MFVLPPQTRRSKTSRQKGFSLIELVIVLLIIAILSVFTAMSFKARKKFLADEQAFKILDILHEARQRSLTQRETFRVEINQTKDQVRLIEENAPNNAADDIVLKFVVLENPNSVVINSTPSNATVPPVSNSTLPIITFKTSVHPLSTGDSVATLRFLRNGEVVDAGSNAVGENAALAGATIYVWMPNYSDSGQPLTTGSIIRAITLTGNSGNAQFWRCPVKDGSCAGWTQ